MPCDRYYLSIAKLGKAGSCLQRAEMLAGKAPLLPCVSLAMPRIWQGLVIRYRVYDGSRILCRFHTDYLPNAVH